MNFPYSSAFGCVTCCRTGIESPRSTERRGDAYKYENGRARSLPSGGSKWLCRWATRINRRCGKVDMRCFAYGHPSHIFLVCRWICPEEINGKTRAISFQNHRQPFSFSPKLFDWRKGVKSPRRRLFTFAQEKPRI